MWYLILNAVLTLWVCIDARKRNEDIAQWAVGTAFLGVIVVPVYLAKRSLLSGETREGGTAWNVLKNFAIVWTILMAFAAGQGLLLLGKEAAKLQGGAEMAGAAIGSFLGFGVLAATWFFPFIGAFVVGLMMKKSSITEKGPTGKNLDAQGSPVTLKKPVSRVDWVVVAILGVVFLYAFSQNMSSFMPSKATSAKAPVGLEKPVTEKEQSWDYRNSTDKMGRGETKMAAICSSNTVSFGFPYQGEQHGTLLLRAHPKFGKDVILSVDKGQFQTGIDGCEVTVRFDEGKPMSFTGVGPESMDTETLFISGYSRFLTNLKKAKKVMIEAPFFQEGTKVFEFNVSGLKWQD